jgi:hypothetical protein
MSQGIRIINTFTAVLSTLISDVRTEVCTCKRFLTVLMYFNTIKHEWHTLT